MFGGGSDAHAGDAGGDDAGGDTGAGDWGGGAADAGGYERTLERTQFWCGFHAGDPGVMRDPTNGTLWLTYGSYFGYIRLVELDPKTGKRLHPERPPVNIAINSEASIMIARDGWYYLLVTHGSCCAGC